MKTQIITLAAILLLALNVSAKNNSSNSAYVVSVTEITNANMVAEEELSIENWMTNDYVWDLASKNLQAEEVSDEKPLQIMGWMTDSTQWIQNANENFNSQTNFENNEEPLTIESWMTNDECWSL